MRLLDSTPYMWFTFRTNGPDEKGAFVWPVVSFEFNGNNINTTILVGDLNNFWGEGKVLTPIQLKQDTWYHVKVEMQGTKVTIWVDDILMRTVDWSSQARLPKIGFIIHRRRRGRIAF